jgi:hypothetical protein
VVAWCVDERQTDSRLVERVDVQDDGGCLVGAADLLPLSDAALGPALAHCPPLDHRTLLPAGHHAVDLRLRVEQEQVKQARRLVERSSE